MFVVPKEVSRGEGKLLRNVPQRGPVEQSAVDLVPVGVDDKTVWEEIFSVCRKFEEPSSDAGDRPRSEVDCAQFCAHHETLPRVTTRSDRSLRAPLTARCG